MSCKATFLALGTGVAIAAFVACGGSSKMSTTAPMMSPGAADGGVLASSPKQQIEELDQKITAKFAELGVARPDAPPTMALECPSPPCAKAETLAVKPSDDPTCIKGATQTCKDTCAIADSICESATKICKISEDLGRDAWSAEKCSSGNTSCETARGKCCGCT